MCPPRSEKLVLKYGKVNFKIYLIYMFYAEIFSFTRVGFVGQ
jgi:hypothetical protein